MGLSPPAAPGRHRRAHSNCFRRRCSRRQPPREAGSGNQPSAGLLPAARGRLPRVFHSCAGPVAVRMERQGKLLFHHRRRQNFAAVCLVLPKSHARVRFHPKLHCGLPQPHGLLHRQRRKSDRSARRLLRRMDSSNIVGPFKGDPGTWGW